MSSGRGKRKKIPSKKPGGRTAAARRRRRAADLAKIDPNRVTRSALARELGCQHSLVVGYMNLEGAPKPDEALRYERTVALEWCRSQAKWAIGGLSPQTKKLKDEKLELEVAELRRQDALQQGNLIDKRDLEDELTAFATTVEATYYKIFYHEFPAKCRGKTEEEIRELAESYLIEAATAIRDGKAGVKGAAA